MKQVILIGDSIRIGYQPTVRRILGEEANVWGPADNGRTSRKVLAHLDEWVLSRQPDLVHINCGLHDLRREFGQPPQVPLAEYTSNVETILRQVLDRTRARILWATITPVNQTWHHEKRNADRFESDVVEYNRAAVGVCVRLGIPIDDLYTVITAAGRDTYMTPEGLHWKPEGYELLGRAVAQAIRSYI